MVAPGLCEPAQGGGSDNAAADPQPHEKAVLRRHRPSRAGTQSFAQGNLAHHASVSRIEARQASVEFRRLCQKPRVSASSKHVTIARAAFGLASTRKSLTKGVPRVASKRSSKCLLATASVSTARA